MIQASLYNMPKYWDSFLSYCILNEEQKWAYDIVDQHLQETLSGKMPPQLLMIIPGKGGVGK